MLEKPGSPIDSNTSSILLSGRTRREFLVVSGKLAAALGLGLIGLNSLLGCESNQRNTQAKTSRIRLGIYAGSQTLWRYVAYKKDTLLRPKGYEADFKTYESEQALRNAFLQKEVDVIATLPTALPGLVESGRSVQYFLPIAWIKEGYPLVSDVNAVIRTVPDLIGRRVGAFPPDHPGMAYWRAFFFRNYGFRIEEKIKLVESTTPEQLLLQGLVDAAFVDSTVWSQFKLGSSFVSITDLRKEWAAISGSDRLLTYGGYIADSEWIGQNQDFVRDFIQINADALKTYKTSKDAILVDATSYSDNSKERIPRETLESISTYLGYDDVDPERAYVTSEDAKDYDTVFRLMYETGTLRRPPESAEKLFYISQRK